MFISVQRNYWYQNFEQKVPATPYRYFFSKAMTTILLIFKKYWQRLTPQYQQTCLEEITGMTRGAVNTTMWWLWHSEHWATNWHRQSVTQLQPHCLLSHHHGYASRPTTSQIQHLSSAAEAILQTQRLHQHQIWTLKFICTIWTTNVTNTMNI